MRRAADLGTPGIVQLAVLDRCKRMLHISIVGSAYSLPGAPTQMLRALVDCMVGITADLLQEGR